MATHNSQNIVNKVVFDGDTLIDLSADTISAADVINSKTFHLADGTIETGTCTYDADTSDATAQAAEILASKTAYKAGAKVTGTMPNIGAQNTDITAKAQQVTISKGYHDGSGKVKISSTEQAKIIAGNIKNGVTLLGVEGTYTGSELIRATTGSATPTTAAQVVLPSSAGAYDYFTQFTVAAIPYSETLNAAGGYTATIG